MSFRRTLPTVFVVFSLGLVIGGFGQPVTVPIPVCRVEVIWEGLETEDVSSFQARIDRWQWGIAVAELPVGVQLPQNYQWDNQHKDALSTFGPIDSYSVPTNFNPWNPRSPVVLFSKSFTRSIELQIVTRTWNFYEKASGNAAHITWLEAPPRTETVACPPTQEIITPDPIIVTDNGSHKYTYKITTTTVVSRNVPGVTLKED